MTVPDDDRPPDGSRTDPPASDAASVGGPAPVPAAARPARRDAWYLAAGAVSTVLAVWALARYSGSRAGLSQLPSGPAGTPGAAAPVPSQDDLVRQKYNMMLQVRANDADGRPMPVGTALPRRMEFTITGANGQPYAQQFDKIGVWAVEIPAGTYTIATAQPGLGNWKWKLTGDALRPATGGGWTITFKTGTMNPMVDLFLY